MAKASTKNSVANQLRPSAIIMLAPAKPAMDKTATKKRRIFVGFVTARAPPQVIFHHFTIDRAKAQ
jgi:hypothetical protein